MKAIAVSLGLALAAAGCTAESHEDQLENQLRNQLSSQGNVTGIELTREGDNITGYAEIQHPQLGPVRLNCAGRVEGARSNANCAPAVTDQLIQDMENNMRRQLSQQGELLELDLERQDDMRITGSGRLRVADGTEVPLDCNITRQSANSLNFNGGCYPPR